MQTDSVHVVERIISLAAPHSCMVCGDEGTVVCDWCLPDFAPSLPERCYRCQAATPNSGVCQKCRRESRLKYVWVRTDYGGRSKQLIHDFKFEHKQAAADPIARLMAGSLPYLEQDTIIVHIPTATRRVRKRGYDPAELIAQALAKRLERRHETLLSRLTQTRQVGAKRVERLEQMETAFRVIKADRVAGASVLLIDDLTTTGATLEAAAKCLRVAGARVVSAAVFAQRQ